MVKLTNIIQPKITLIVENIWKQLFDTATRIRRQILKTSHSISYLLPYFIHPSFYNEQIFVTDRPEAVFGKNKTLYTITSSLALQNIQNIREESLLHPSAIHRDLHIQTHRGLGLRLLSKIMKAFGLENALGAKDLFVWLGPQIDGEQFVLEDRIARKGIEEIDKQIASKFFKNPDVLNVNDLNKFLNLKINPMLEELIEAINNGISLYDTRPDIAEYVEELLKILHEYIGIRGIWFNLLESLLKGKVPPQKKINFDDIWTSLISSTFKYYKSKPSFKISQAVILEIDTPTLLSKTPIYPFPLTSRPPEAIVPAPHLPPEAVKAIYIEGSPDEYLESARTSFGFGIKSLEELPLDKWLTDIKGTPITPDTARKRSIDPRNPVCILRYGKDPTSTWAEHIMKGNIASWGYIPPVNLISEESYLKHILQNIVLNEARQSGLLDIATQIISSQATAENRILTEALFAFKKKGGLLPFAFEEY